MPPQPPRNFLDCLPLIESSLFRSSWGGLPPAPTPSSLFQGLPPRQPPPTPPLFLDFSIIMRPLLFRFFAPNFSIIGGLPGCRPPQLREANLLVMLAMLAGHAGDVENDADDVDGRIKYVHFARKCCKLQHFSRQDGKQKQILKLKKKNINIQN